MLEFIETNESTIRLGFFFGILVLMWLWETLSPRRTLSVSRLFRWVNNLGLVVLNTIVLRFVFPAAAVGMAIMAQKNGWGVVSILDWNPVLIIIFSIIVLDFMIWLQHVAVHAIPAFWRLHRVHHADRDYDTTTGLRFHPLEILLSMVIKLLDKVLRILFVTPDMHRVHHSVEDDEANSNFGFNLSIWDRLFGTYVDQPRAGHNAMTIGIDGFEEKNDVNRIDGMLLLPFKAKMSGYVINRRSWK